MAKKIAIAAVASLLSALLIFVIIKHTTDILQQGKQASGGHKEHTTNTEATESTNTKPAETTPETTAAETRPTEIEPPPSQETSEPQKNENAVTPTDSPIKPTKPPVQTEELPKWKQMYINHATVWRTRYDHFALVYIDGDEVPELYMYGNNQSELCAFRNDAIYSLRMNGMGGGNYHKKSGHVLNVCSEGEYLAMYVYELTDVFRQTFYGREDKNITPPVYYIGNYTGAVSEEEFKNAVNQHIDTGKTEFLHQNAVTFDAFPAYVTDF